jgi:hypothetical protein
MEIDFKLEAHKFAEVGRLYACPALSGRVAIYRAEELLRDFAKRVLKESKKKGRK